MAPSNQVFSAFSFLSFVLTAVPFAWHLQAWNTGTCIYMGWISLTSLLLFINSVVWNGNAINSAPLYCDIATKILVGAAVSVPAAALCINRRLYYIVSIKSVTRTVSEKRRGVLVDLAIGVGIPIVVMILHVVVQGHRFDIYEDIGCWPNTYNTALAYALILAPTLGLSIIASIYSILCIISLKRNYAEFKKLLSSNGTNQATANRYIRLMCLAALEAFLDVPYNIYIIVVHATQGDVQPWISWDDTHFDFNRFDAYPAMIWRANKAAAIDYERTRWTIVVLGFIFFAFFGFADEAIKNYKLAYNFFAKRLGLRLAYIPGLSPPSTNPPSTVGSGASYFWNKNKGGGGGGEKAGVLKANGTESWMNSFDAFADKVKLVVLRSPRVSGINSARSSLNLNVQPGHGQSVYMPRSEMMQRRDLDSDSTSVLTQFTDFSCSTPGFVIDGEERSMYTPSIGLRRRSSYASQGSDTIGAETEGGSKYDARSLVDSMSQYSLSSLYSLTITTSAPPKSPLPPPVPPKDPAYVSPLATAATLSSPSLTVPVSALRLPTHGYRDNDRDFVSTPSSSPPPTPPQQQRLGRTPPKQEVPTSVSVSPTPNGSFLDLSTSEVDMSPLRHIHSADNQV